MKLKPQVPTQMTEQEVADALREDDPWLQRYPTMEKYLQDLLNELGMDGADINTLYELYANRIEPEDVVNIWGIYDDEEEQEDN